MTLKTYDEHGIGGFQDLGSLKSGKTRAAMQETRNADCMHIPNQSTASGSSHQTIIGSSSSLGAIRVLAQKMSDFYYAQDMGDKSVKQSPCPAIIAATVGCL